MRSALLHLDEALARQARLRDAVRVDGGREINCRDLGPTLRLWSRPSPLREFARRLAAALPASDGPMLVFAGSGDFHHVTPVLLARALEAAGHPRVTVVHFDNHPDWARFSPGVHCGSWVGQAARLPQVEKVVTVGVCSRDLTPREARRADLREVADGKVDLFAYSAAPDAEAYAVAGRAWPTIDGLGEEGFAAYLPGQITTEAVYLTIDKDVLRPEDAGTNWDQGRASLAYLATLVRVVLADRRLIGADIFGDWSAPRYGGGLLSALLKRGEAALDQPWRAPSADLRARNEAVNLVLLNLFREAAA